MSKTLTRLLAVAMCVVMTLTAAPLGGFVASAEETTKDTIVFGSYVWDVVRTEDDGDLVLITTDVLAKAKFNNKAPMNFATSTLYTTLNTDFYGTFSDAEKAAITPTTIIYDYWDATSAVKVTGATLSANVVLPDAEMAESLGKAYLVGTTTATAYFLASARAKYNTDSSIAAITKAGAISTASGTGTTTGYRPVITLKAGNFAKFPTVEGVSFTVSDKAVTYYALTSSVDFEVVVDTKNYATDNMTVTLGGEALTATDSVYTIPADSTGAVAVTGLVAQPADFTAYNEALAQAAEVDKELYDTADLDAAIAVDVSACTKLEQAKVDEATAAILDAIANLQYKPADTAAYLNAVEETRRILANEPVEITPTLTAPLYNLYAAANEIGDSFNNAMLKALGKYEDRTATPISGYTIDRQADVDAATAVFEDLNARVPLMRASTSAWSKALNDIKNLSPNRYSNAAELIAEAEALVAEKDYVALNLDITHQSEIDEATAALKEIIARAEIILVDFTDLETAYERSVFYTENEDVYCYTSGWESFSAALVEANEFLLDKDYYSDASFIQSVALTAEQLNAAMDEMDVCVAMKIDSNADQAISDKVIWFYDVNEVTLYVGGTGTEFSYSPCFENAKNLILSKNSTAVFVCDYLYNLEFITVSSDNPNYSNNSYGVLFNEDKTTLIKYPSGNTRTSYTVPDSVTAIGSYAFCDCTNLTSVTIPDSVTSIGNFAFSDCTNLTRITIGDSVTTIGVYAFYDCISLTSVTIPDSVITIGECMFCNCTSLKSVIIGDNVTTLYGGAFSGCTSLTNITFGSSVTYIGYETFAACTGLTSVTIPDSVTTIGIDAFLACTSLTSVTIGNSVTTIGEGAFKDCTSLTSVTIGNSVTSIGDEAFYNCTSLTSVTIGNSVTTIGEGAFRDCESLTRITIGDSVTYIGGSAFQECTSLTNITIPDSVTTIEMSAFYNCSSLKSITIGNSVTTIGDMAFAFCDSLTSVTIGNSVTTIGFGVFAICESLTSVTIPDSVTSIGEMAFSCCTSLTDVYYGSTEDDWNKITIGSDNEPLTSANIHYSYVKPSVAPVNGAVVDNENGTIYGLVAGVDSLDSYIELADGYEWSYNEGQYGFGTGTVATLKNGDEIIAEYTILIFGDIDGNGWYDANDAFIVNMIASGLIPVDRLSAAQLRAADCNHDGKVDSADFYLLNQASLMLEDVDQSATKEDLATNAMYISYCSLIDQTAGEETNLIPVPDNDEAPSDSTADAAPSEPAEANDFEAIFTMIIDFFKKIFTFVFSFVIK